MDRKARRLSWCLVVLCALPLAWGVWHFDFLCDDAYISFRYARNLAGGLGLVFNPGEASPVEGYTNLLWVLWLSVGEWLGLGSPLVSRVGSVTCAAGLFALVAVHLLRVGCGRLGLAAGLLFLATLPAMAVWTTGGLETMAFSLAAFAFYDRQIDARPGRRPVGLVLALIALLGLRADGFVWAGLVLASVALGARLRADRALARRCLYTALLALFLATSLFVWRRWNYGTWVPNTARVKLAFGTLALERGGLYLLNFLASAPSAALALLLGLAALVRRRDLRLLPAALCAAGNFAYVLVVGGDFMAMGRFLVPGMAFVALLLAAALDVPAGVSAGRRGLTVLGLASVALLGLAAALDRTPVPHSWRARLDFRWSQRDFESEVQRWASARQAALVWRLQGRMLADIAEPGDSLVIGTIGAVGYYSDLFIHDPFGLVNRDPLSATGELGRRSAGHEKRVPLEVFLARKPTFLESRFVPEGMPDYMLREGLAPGGELHGRVALEFYPTDPATGAAPGWVLRVVRYLP